jgi:hypothetical protein
MLTPKMDVKLYLIQEQGYESEWYTYAWNLLALNVLGQWHHPEIVSS